VGEVSRSAKGDPVRPSDRVCTVFAQKWIAGRPTRERVRSTLGGPLDGTLANWRSSIRRGW